MPAQPAARSAMLAETLRGSPALLPALIVVGVLVALGAAEAGHSASVWEGTAIFLLALLVVSLLALGLPTGAPRALLAALGLLAAFTAWSYLSILWAGQQAPAWEGANRAALYLILFAQLSLWRFDARGGRLVIALLALGIAGLGLVELLSAERSARPGAFFAEARLVEPAGYINANVCLWTLGLFACLGSAASRELAAPLRALALGGAGLLGALALMGQSRGWAFALPLALIAFLALYPGRVRLLAAMAATLAGVAAVSGPVLDIHDEFALARIDGLLHEATSAILPMAAVLAVVGLVWALLDRRVELGERTGRRLGAAVAALVALVVVVGVVAYVADRGSPTTEIADSWDEFKEGSGTPGPGGSRFTTAGTNRYDFWTVAWDLFEDHPLRGIGSDNFQAEYQRRGNSGEQPRFAHSLELGVLSQTGIVGGALLAGALAAALLAAAPLRRGPRPAAATGAAALGVFAYWLLHASVDWFWEFPALTGIALAMLGLATALARGAEPAPLARPSGEPPGRSRRRVLALLLVSSGILALSFGFPWLAELQIDRASEGWRQDPPAAFERLNAAEGLNPLSPRPQLTAGTIALRLRQVQRARREFAEALERDPTNVYALLELGLIRAELGDRAGAIKLLERAANLTPRDEVVLEALEAASSGRPLSSATFNARILRRARSRTPKLAR